MAFKKTREEILGEILADASRNVPQISYYEAGGVFRLFLEITASLLAKAYGLLDALQPNRFLQTAEGQYLDWKAEELGLSRRAAVKARGYVILGRDKASSNLSIAKGKIIASLPDSQGKELRYIILEEVTMEEGLTEKAVLVEAESEGALYNNPRLGKFVTPIGGIDRISRPEGWLVQVGLDTESDASLRGRCQALWKGIGGANRDAYIFWAKSVKGVGGLSVLPTARGAGTVDVVCTAEGGMQPSPELLASVQEVIDLNKPIATDCLVHAPHEVYVDVGVSLIFSPGYTPQKQPAEERVRRFFEEMSIGTDYEPSALVGALSALKGIKAVVLSGMDSKRISELQIARLGVLSVDVSSGGEA